LLTGLINENPRGDKLQAKRRAYIERIKFRAFSGG
jgi:hypothetical protein